MRIHVKPAEHLEADNVEALKLKESFSDIKNSA